MGGKSGGDTETTQKMEPWKGVQPFLTSYMNNAGQIASQPYEAFQGQRIAGLSPEQQMGMNMTTSRALNGSPVMNAAQANLTDTLSGRYMSPDSNPWLKQNVDTALGQAGSAINSQFNKPGAFGSSAHEGVMANQFGNIASQMYGQNYDQERTRQMQANMFAPQAAAADYADAQALMGVGNINREMTQSLIDQDYADWQQAQQYPYMQSDFMKNAVLAGQGAGSTSTTKTEGAGSSGLANALGGGILGHSLGSAASDALMGNVVSSTLGAGTLNAMPWLGTAIGAMFSDERVKTDIKKVGKTDEGLNVYTYRYKWGGPPMMGVMAQEVEKKHPEAVMEFDGIKAVNYGLLG